MSTKYDPDAENGLREAEDEQHEQATTTTDSDDAGDETSTRSITDVPVSELAENNAVRDQFAYAMRDGVTDDRVDAFLNVVDDLEVDAGDASEAEIRGVLHRGAGYIDARIERLEAEFHRHVELAETFEDLRRSKHNDADDLYREVHDLAEKAGVSPDV